MKPEEMKRKYISLGIALVIFIIFCIVSVIFAKQNIKVIEEPDLYWLPKSSFAYVSKNTNAKPKNYQVQVKNIKTLMGEIAIDETSVEYDDYKRINRFNTNDGYCTIQYYDDGSFIIRNFDKNQVMQRTVQKSKNGKINEELFTYDKNGNAVQEIQKFQLSANELLFYFSNVNIKNRLKTNNNVEYIYNKATGTYTVKGNNLEIKPSAAPGIMYSTASIDFNAKSAPTLSPLKDITVEGNNNIITGSDSNDFISVIGNYNTIDMKKGTDTVYIKGKNNTVKNVEKKILK